MICLKEALQKAASFLRSQGLDQPRLEAEILLVFVLRRERIYLYTYAEENLSAEDWADYWRLVQRRAAGEPIAYLTCGKEFMGFPFKVTEGVLIPRPETEHLVEAVIDWVKKVYPRAGETGPEREPVHILDLGTGCGNIVVSLLRALPGALAVGIDMEQKAVELTRYNAASLGVDGRLEIICGRYWEDLQGRGQKYQVIVSNPPYISASGLASLPAEVTHEPRSALDGGEDGLDAYREIFAGLTGRLAEHGLLALEAGQGQSAAILDMAAHSACRFARTEVLPDYAGIDRILLFET